MTQAPTRNQGYVTSPYDVELRLRSLADDLDSAQDHLQNAEHRYHAAKAAFEVQFARAFMASDESSAEARKQDAVLRTAEEKQELAVAEATVRAARANVARLEQQVDITRSVGRLVTTAMNL